MIERCINPHSKAWSDYGGRGIVVCGSWLIFENFLQDMGEKPEGKSIDRIDVNGNYEPANCRWADAITQARNTRRALLITINGVTRPLKEWCELKGRDYHKVWWRLYRQGLSPKQALL